MNTFSTFILLVLGFICFVGLIAGWVFLCLRVSEKRGWPDWLAFSLCFLPVLIPLYGLAHDLTTGK
jgi:uncharacterized membrane protein